MVPIPPINEQKRISKKLDELLTAVGSIKTRLDNAPKIIKRFRQSILTAVTSGELTKKCGVKKVDMKLLRAVCQGCGPSLYKADASKVACGQASELETIQKGFCAKKLGITDGDKAMKAIKEVCADMGSSNRNKQRAVFYYLLVKKLRKSAVYA